MSFGIYFKRMFSVILSSTLALGLLVGIVLLVFGGFTMNLEGDIEIGRFDGLWLVFGLPILSALVFVILSPLSFLLSRLISSQHHD